MALRLCRSPLWPTFDNPPQNSCHESSNHPNPREKAKEKKKEGSQEKTSEATSPGKITRCHLGRKGYWDQRLILDLMPFNSSPLLSFAPWSEMADEEHFLVLSVWIWDRKIINPLSRSLWVQFEFRSGARLAQSRHLSRRLTMIPKCNTCLEFTTYPLVDGIVW